MVCFLIMIIRWVWSPQNNLMVSFSEYLDIFFQLKKNPHKIFLLQRHKTTVTNNDMVDAFDWNPYMHGQSIIKCVETYIVDLSRTTYWSYYVQYI